MAASWFPNGPILVVSPSALVWTRDMYRALVGLTTFLTIVDDAGSTSRPRHMRSDADTSFPQASGCCPSTGQCCPGSRYCKAQSNGVCCGSSGTCPAGYTCSSRCSCVETGGTCCSNGRYCAKGNKCCTSGCAPNGGECCSNGQICDTGNICVVNKRTGRYGCCTNLSCTAYVESGSTIALTPTASKTTAAPKTTAPPRVTSSVVYDVRYQYYYWTMTWYTVPFLRKPALPH